MSNLVFKEAKNQKGKVFNESLRLSKEGLKGRLKMYDGKSGDFYVALIPSLNTSGYGDTPEDAKKDLQYNLDQFFRDIFAVEEIQRHKEILKLGWKKHQFFKKRYSSSYVDENGVLQNFDNPKKVNKTYLETA